MYALIRALLASLILTLGFGLWPTMTDTAHAQEVDPFALLFGSEDPDIDVDDQDGAGTDDLNIVTLRLRDLILDDGFMAYETVGGLCLPFQSVADAFEFPITVSDDGMAEGWFVETRRTVEIDFESELVLLSDAAIDLPSDPFLQTDDGWCATLDALSDIFPISFIFDDRNLRINAEPDEILPIEAKLEREAFREAAMRVRPRGYDQFPVAENPYRWLSWPAADVGVDFRTGANGDVAINFDIEAAGDMLMTSGRIRTVAGNDAGVLDNLRVTLGRSNTEPVELGPLAARRFSVGDINTPGLPLVARGVNGAGVVITNRSAFQADLFDTTEVRGPLPKDWEAELYEGQQLLAFVTEPDSNGDYVFDSVPLKSGYNRFTVKLYGPFGETEERQVKFFVGAELEPENETSYYLGVVNSRTPVVETLGLASGADDDPANQFPDDISEDDDDFSALFNEGFERFEEQTLQENGLLAVGSASHGLTDTLTVRVDGTLALEASRTHETAASVSIASSVAGGYGVARVATDGSGRPAVEAAFQRRIFETSNISLRAVSYGDLENAITGRGTARRSALAELRANSSLAIAGRSIPVQLGVNYSQSVDGGTYLDASSRLSTNLRGIRLTKSFQYSYAAGADETADAFGGSLIFSRRAGTLRLLGGVGYDVQEAPRLTSVGLSAQRAFGRNSTGSLSLSHSMDSDDTALSASWSQTFDHMTLSTTGSVSDSQGWTLGMRLGFSLGKERGSSLPRFSSDSELSRTSVVESHVFVDDNLNGIYDTGEDTIEGAQLTINGSIRQEETDADGRVVLEKIALDGVQHIAVNLSSIDDPFLFPAVPGTAYLPRPGQTFTVPIALQPTGDVEGYLTIIKGEVSLSAAGVPVQVLDGDGRVVGETTSDFDGYFYLDKLPLRDLTLRVDSASIEGADVVSEDVAFTLTADEPSLFGAELDVFVG